MEEEVDMIENVVHSRLESSGLAIDSFIAWIFTKAQFWAWEMEQISEQDRYLPALVDLTVDKTNNKQQDVCGEDVPFEEFSL